VLYQLSISYETITRFSLGYVSGPLLYCRQRSRSRLPKVWEGDTAACGWHRIFLVVADLDISTAVMTSLFGIMAMTVSSLAVKIVSFFNSLLGLFTRIPTTIHSPIPIWNAHRITTISIWTILPRLCNRNPSVASPTMTRLSL
jgi:hypothetical protein